MVSSVFVELVGDGGERDSASEPEQMLEHIFFGDGALGVGEEGMLGMKIV